MPHSLIVQELLGDCGLWFSILYMHPAVHVCVHLYNFLLPPKPIRTKDSMIPLAFPDQYVFRFPSSVHFIQPFSTSSPHPVRVAGVLVTSPRYGVDPLQGPL